MANIIVAEEDKLRSIVQEEVSKLLSTKQDVKPEIDTLTLTKALALLSEYGYPMSKAKLYKLTSSGNIPCRKFGQKLVFSRKDILSWAESQTKPKDNSAEIVLTLARSARRKK
ncbi:hypothetical protein M2451_001528 [Dysgonomonas sp. PFB1-18]|uniref:helix-turn-helix domain-containing protein n=1 Tax=unclassified Dysgonomonas TaxID=2630389 RepID=UPI0024754DA0|nr:MULTISPECIES: helix-turn-helix domain-containing protein [unclassified Dysgonomonas]MDH6309014.1 hypothetical protein [Dysgonomonas sp. PF1-14]MDH6338765.1 hypothetical protein [Dysgonomonas sp. PF1-16]MDH6380207.1 hypothetical protein [Dysgonomonas sp. PFB1-18]MDH6397537.1 hypothetical protein [Dysgonomonas sp. PF1-23]